jgi:hypothetical protein
MDRCAKVLDGTILHGRSLLVERAMPSRDDQRFHILVPNVPGNYRARDLWRLLRPSKCGPTNSELGYDDRGNWIGISQVETVEACQEAVVYLRSKGFHRASWAPGPPPLLYRTSENFLRRSSP